MLMQSRAELSNGDGMMPMAILIIVKIPNNSSAVMNTMIVQTQIMRKTMDAAKSKTSL